MYALGIFLASFFIVTGASLLAQWLWFKWRWWRRSREASVGARVVGIKLYLKRDEKTKLDA